MTQNNNFINEFNIHLEKYLDYYCGLGHSPGFAVLLKGEWGSGKTWFVKKYKKHFDKRNKRNKQKCLYVSLNGITSVAQIEYEFFLQLNPLFNSKGARLAGQIFGDIIRGSGKVGPVTLKLPTLNQIPKYLLDLNNPILIFDDLERCSIPLKDRLGYINSFVEQQELRVILVANEEELLIDKSNDFSRIKEKLIGKTFEVNIDINAALNAFIQKKDNVKKFLSENISLIEDIYLQANFKNLRCLKQVISDFEFIFNVLPKEAKSSPDFLKDLFSVLMAFTIEINRGAMTPKDILKLEDELVKSMRNNLTQEQISKEKSNENQSKENKLGKIASKYYALNLHSPFPNSEWWYEFFDKGKIDVQILEQLLPNSKYFADENSSAWLRLLNSFKGKGISDNDFDDLFEEVKSEYENRELTDLGAIKHVFGLFLMFSESGIYSKDKSEILQDAKDYIGYLRTAGKFEVLPRDIEYYVGGYLGFAFSGKEYQEFKEFEDYISKINEVVRKERMPFKVKQLLAKMEKEPAEFRHLIYLNNNQSEDPDEREYYKTPLFISKYVAPTEFVSLFLRMSIEDQRSALFAFKKRYEVYNQDLISELPWLRSVKNLLLQESENRKGKLSGFWLSEFCKQYLEEAISSLEASNNLN
ncbi:KAP P-loop domain protein [Thalassoporum mexicanum PCC 7367]|uniref:P-loop NTPase fold protein n=1 Tax=Thalassoporum mexicanum TaxID=3457544 RepID=UPI00029FC67C|nr:P-loop NTPase fold protein [Pseudanabaena sp. PCC 7367]AFY71643.1 KAP P-loop domain protein [Pseudanabaena sp. PCC 7367]